jgi:signal transduction histidine kinase
MSLWFAIAATLCNVSLVAVAAGLVRKDHRRRTQELIELSTHLQSVAEREKANLARELHDELGGLLVGARMDVSWAEQHLSAGDLDLKTRLNRVQQNLSAGIDLKRRIIEELRPTLLDNVGFIAALRWQLKDTCAHAGLKCTEYFPDEEPRLNSDAAIALFRIAQEAFANVIKHAGAKAVDVTLDIDEDDVMLSVKDDGKGFSEGNCVSGATGMASMRHRVRALGGRLDVSRSPSGGTLLGVRIPLSRALRSPAEAEAL